MERENFVSVAPRGWRERCARHRDAALYVLGGLCFLALATADILRGGGFAIGLGYAAVMLVALAARGAAAGPVLAIMGTLGIAATLVLGAGEAAGAEATRGRGFTIAALWAVAGLVYYARAPRPAAVHRSEDVPPRLAALKESRRLTSGFAHDFNNLLGVIIGNLEMLGKRVKDDGARKRVVQALLATFRTKVLTQRLLAFADGRAPHPCAVDVNALLRDVGELYELLGNGVGAEFDLEDGLPLCNVDSAMESALLDLALQVRDAIPEGALLQFRTERCAKPGRGPDGALDLAPGIYACLQISCTGGAIPRERLLRVFGPLLAPDAENRDMEVEPNRVRGLVRQAGGDIAVSCGNRDGMSARLYLPVSDM